MTNGSGVYQWFVPEGEWQVRVTAPEGYSDNTSASHPAANKDDGSTPGWLPVMPVQMGINIPLVRDISPVVESVMICETHAEIVFNIYMDTSTLTDKTVTLFDKENVIPCMIVFPDEDADPMDEDKYYARTMCLSVAGGFDTDKEYRVTVEGAATAYNGRSLGAYDSGEIGTAAASVTWNYNVLKQTDNGYKTEKHVYKTEYYNTFAEAIDAACVKQEFEDLVMLDPGDTFIYAPPVITLLKNAAIAEGETVTANSKNGSLTLDLNGFTLDVKGTFKGDCEGYEYDPATDTYDPVLTPVSVSVESTFPGVFRSSGTLGVDLYPWTGDTYYITGGTITGAFAADGGNINISGGIFTGWVLFNNGNFDEALTVDISGGAEFRSSFDVAVYTDGDPKPLCVTVGGGVKAADLSFIVLGDGEATEPGLIINGGYFKDDPRTLTDREGFVQITYEPEEYAEQENWDADGTVYRWRVMKDFVPGDVNGDGSVNNKDVVALFKYVSGSEVAVNVIALDINGDGSVNNKDVVALFKYVSGGDIELSDKPYDPNAKVMIMAIIPERIKVY